MTSKLTIRPLKVFCCLVMTATSLISLTSAAPAPKPDLVDEWNANKVHQVKGEDGTVYELSTRDIILISATAILIFFILVCLIGYCLCECVRSIICCICCCE